MILYTSHNHKLKLLMSVSYQLFLIIYKKKLIKNSCLTFSRFKFVTSIEEHKVRIYFFKTLFIKLLSAVLNKLVYMIITCLVKYKSIDVRV